jgi:hypothetical protein
MNHQHIIDWKISSLQNVDLEQGEHKFTQEMQAYLDLHPELNDELAFIDMFWQQEAQEQPSTELDKRFYQMLSQAKSAQNSKVNARSPLESGNKETNSQGLLTTIKNWWVFKPMQPVGQAVALGLMFVIGFNVNQSTPSNVADISLQNLQQEVSSLSSMLALSMLQKSSAAERLTGVAYSRQTDLSDPLLMTTLITALAKDKSTAVRLAIINALSSMPDIHEQESELLALAIKESNTLVQIELCRLLLNVGSQHTKNKLRSQLSATDIDPEVKEFLMKVNSISHI